MDYKKEAFETVLDAYRCLGMAIAEATKTMLCNCSPLFKCHKCQLIEANRGALRMLEKWVDSKDQEWYKCP